MTDIERQILLNHVAILETLMQQATPGVDSTRELLAKRYVETAEFLRQHSTPHRG
jgi:hypothetical protein